MCGESTATKSGSTSAGAMYGTEDRKSWAKAHGVGFYGDPTKPVSETNNPHGTYSASQANTAFGEGTAPSSLGNNRAAETGQQGALGTVPTAQPVVKSHLTSLFGPVGAQGIEEMEQAFQYGRIDVPEDMEWVPGQGVVGGQASWTPKRNVVGRVIDSVGDYDRSLSPERVQELQERGNGSLAVVAEQLSKGNMQYKDSGLAPDALGILGDLVSPAYSLISKNIAGLLLGGHTIGKTLYAQNKMFGGSVGSGQVAETATNDLADGGRGQQAVILGQTGDDDSETQTKARLGRQTLIKTGGRGVTSKANLLFTGLGRG